MMEDPTTLHYALNLADLRYSPDRKWKIITHIFQENLPFDKYEKLIQQGVLFLKLYNQDPLYAKRQFKRIAFCHDLRFSENGRHHLLEAFILTGASTKKVSKEFGLRQYELKLYKSLFFDVDRMLPNETVVLISVFMPVLKFPRLIEVNPEYIWKFIGYYGGFDLLKEYIRFGDMSESGKKHSEKLIYSDFLRKAILHARLYKPTQYHAPEILTSFVRILKDEKMTSDFEEKIKDIYADALNQLSISTHDFDSMLNEYEVPSINKNRISFATSN